MISYGWSVAILLVFGIAALIWGVVYYTVNIAHSDFRKKLIKEEFQIGTYGEEPLVKQQEQFRTAQDHQNYFVQIITDIEYQIDEFFSNQNKLACMFGGAGIIFVYLITSIFDPQSKKPIGAISYLVGLIVCIGCHTFAMNVLKQANSEVILYARKDVQQAQIAYYAGLSIGSVFVGAVIVSVYLLEQMLDWWVIAKDTDQEYLVYVLCCYACGYAVASLIYRITGGIFNGGITIASDVFSRNEGEIASESSDNPASISIRAGNVLGGSLAQFTDTTNAVIFLVAGASVLMCDSKELINANTILFFPLMFLISVFLCTFVCSFIGQGKQGSKKQTQEAQPSFTAQFVKKQLAISHILILLFIVFLPYFCYPSKFTMGFDVANSKDSSVSTKKNGTHYTVTYCLLIGYIMQVVLITFSEFFTSHFYKPVQSLIQVCEDGPFFNLISSTILGSMPQIIGAVCFLIGYLISFSLLGFYGVSLAALGLLSNILVISGMHELGGVSHAAHKTVILCKLYGPERTRLANQSWAAMNYQIHVKSVCYGAMCFGATAYLGMFVNWLNDINYLKINAYIITGLITGAAVIYFLFGVITISVQYFATKVIFLLRQMLQAKQATPNYSLILKESITQSTIGMLWPVLASYIFTILLGLMFGPAFIIGYMLAHLVTASYVYISSAMSAAALSNAKIFAENNSFDDKDKNCFLAALAGNTLANSYKDASGPSMLLFTFSNLSLSMICAVCFSKANWLGPSTMEATAAKF